MKGLPAVPSNPCHIFHLFLPCRGRLGQWIISMNPNPWLAWERSHILLFRVFALPSSVFPFPCPLLSLLYLLPHLHPAPPLLGYDEIKSVCPLRGCWEGLLVANATRTRTEFFSLWHPRVLKVSLPLWGCMSLEGGPSSSVCSVGVGWRHSHTQEDPVESWSPSESLPNFYVLGSFLSWPLSLSKSQGVYY